VRCRRIEVVDGKAVAPLALPLISQALPLAA
jgi:hypothetical protein